MRQHHRHQEAPLSVKEADDEWKQVVIQNDRRNARIKAKEMEKFSCQVCEDPREEKRIYHGQTWNPHGLLLSYFNHKLRGRERKRWAPPQRNEDGTSTYQITSEFLIP